ncbi:MAG: hypothetical protein ABIU54_11385 [Candidatus Eisenbacteria bacterium]
MRFVQAMVCAVALVSTARSVLAHSDGSADWDSVAARAQGLGTMTAPAVAERIEPRQRGAAAQRWSTIATLVPVATGLTIRNEAGAYIALGGVILGPSTGYFVGRHPWRGVGGSLGRVGLTAIGATIAAVATVQGLGYDNEGAAQAAAVWATAAGLGVLASAVYDIATVRSSVERHAALSERIRLHGMRAPGSGAPALALRVTF